LALVGILRCWTASPRTCHCWVEVVLVSITVPSKVCWPAKFAGLRGTRLYHCSVQGHGSGPRVAG
jgi:hypothetical protein